MTNGAASPSRGAARRRVVVVDDHAAFADLLRLALDGLDDLECVGTARTSAAAVELVERVAPEIAVVDLLLGAEDGLELVGRLRAGRPDLVLVVSSASRTPARSPLSRPPAPTASRRRAASSPSCSTCCERPGPGRCR